MFMTAQVHFSPFKLPLDNMLRFTTELHTIITILVALLIQTDDSVEDRQILYDVVVLGTVGVLVLVPFVAVVAVKLREVQAIMRESLSQVSSQNGPLADVHMAIRRFELGLQSNEDRQTMLAYFDELGTGAQIWRDKVIVSHLTPDEMRMTLSDLEATLPKSQALAYHFTDLDSARLILSSIGIRAATVGQLGGGEKLCFLVNVLMQKR
jgi:hypothetical protein